MPTERVPLSQPIETRDGTLSKDSKCVNGYFESRDRKREFVKRPGLALTAATLPVGNGQGLAFFNGFIYAVVTNIVYKIDPSTYTTTVIGTLTGPIKDVYFTPTLNNGYLFLHNQLNGYLINGSTGAFSQITNDTVATTTILTGGSQYSSGTTVTFSAPSSGVTATGTVQTTLGVVTGITITNAGSGYTFAPTLTFTPATTLSSVSVSNTSGTSTLTASSLSGTVYVGMTVTGTGIPSTTTVTAISGTGPYTITLSNATTSAVTSATFTDAGNGATATSLLNFFPTGGLVPGVVYMDSYVLVGTLGARLYSCQVGNPTIWNPLDYITADSEPDLGKGIGKHLNYILSFGQWSTDFFYDNANLTGSPFSNAPSYKAEIGCANGDSIVQFEQTIAWVGTSKTVGTGIYLMDGVTPTKISTSYIERILGNSSLTEMTAYAVKVNGHMLYILTIHDLNVTIVYDVNEKIWYQWTMYAPDSTTGIYSEQYFRPSYFAGTGTVYYVLDDDTGILYTMSDNYYTDAGAPIYYRAVTDILDSGTTKRKFYERVEIIGDKVAATMMIRNTSDDYNTWSSYKQVNLNASRSQIHVGGASRRRAWEFLCTDNVPLRIEAAEIDFKIGEMENEGIQPTNIRR